MSVSSGSKLIPFVPPSAVGPLGIKQLPRFWTKVMLSSRGMLEDSYYECGPLDLATLEDLGLDRDATVAYLKAEKPTYVAFEKWVKAHGTTDPDTIRRHNERIEGWQKKPEVALEYRARLGLEDDSIGNSEMLNFLEDLHDFHGTMRR